MFSSCKYETIKGEKFATENKEQRKWWWRWWIGWMLYI
jgi:hypothetical protein